MKRILLFCNLLTLLLLLLGCHKDPPHDFELINEESYTFESDGSKLVVNVPDVVAYYQPKYNDGDCGNGVPNRVTQNWQISNNTDYIEVSIELPQGVLPGLNHSRGFILYNNNLNHGSPTVKATLTMESGAGNTSLVRTVTWRFMLNAVEDIPNEIIQTGEENTANPFLRKTITAPLGSQWTIIVPSQIQPENVYATIRYSLHMGNVKICHL